VLNQLYAEVIRPAEPRHDPSFGFETVSTAAREDNRRGCFRVSSASEPTPIAGPRLDTSLEVPQTVRTFVIGKGDELLKQLFEFVAIVVVITVLALPRMTGAQVSRETLESISTPDKVETDLGTLQFKEGAPTAETAQKVYDGLDYVRGVDAFMKASPAHRLMQFARGSIASGRRTTRWSYSRS
jgi:hypothetical protein